MIFWLSLIVGAGLLINSCYLFITNSSTVGISQFYFHPIVKTPSYLLLLSIVFISISVFLFVKRNKESTKITDEKEENLSRHQRRKKNKKL